MTTEELLYERESYHAKHAVRQWEVVALSGNRAGVMAQSLAANETGDVYIWGPFHYETDAEFEVAENGKVYFDLMAQTPSMKKTPNSILFGSALIPCPRGSKFVMIQLNG